MQLDMSELDMHWPLHDALQLVEQLPEQLKLPGFAMHAVMQSPEQPPVQLALMETMQLPVTLAVQLRGWQLAVHPPDVSKVHERPAAPEKSMFPQAAIGAASAVAGHRETSATR